MTEFAHGLNPYRYEERSRASNYERHPWQRFDRVAFALRALRLLIPTNTRIAVFRSNHLHVVQVPILLGRGVRLWDGLEALEDAFDIETVASPSGVTHLTFTRRPTA